MMKQTIGGRGNIVRQTAAPLVKSALAVISHSDSALISLSDSLGIKNALKASAVQQVLFKETTYTQHERQHERLLAR